MQERPGGSKGPTAAVCRLGESLLTALVSDQEAATRWCWGGLTVTIWRAWET